MNIMKQCVDCFPFRFWKKQLKRKQHFIIELCQLWFALQSNCFLSLHLRGARKWWAVPLNCRMLLLLMCNPYFEMLLKDEIICPYITLRSVNILTAFIRNYSWCLVNILCKTLRFNSVQLLFLPIYCVAY